MYNAVASTINNRIGPTDVTVSAEQAAFDGNTDVVYFDSNYSNYCGFLWNGSGGAAIGLYECQSLSGSKCQSAWVRFDTSWTDTATDPWRRALSCHESGHSLGLLPPPQRKRA